MGFGRPAPGMVFAQDVAARPDMSVLEAADAMERGHGSRIYVRDQERIVGLLTEEDIIQKVLAQGRRPDAVSVREVMQWAAAGGAAERATFTFFDPNEWGIGAGTYDGRCDECGLFSRGLVEQGGTLRCPACDRSR